MEPLWCVCADQMDLFAEDLMEPAHTPTHCTGTTTVNGVEVEFDYVGCSVCRIDHPIIGPGIAQPWERAHPVPLPSTATQTVPDGREMRL